MQNVYLGVFIWGVRLIWGGQSGEVNLGRLICLDRWGDEFGEVKLGKCEIFI